MIPDYNAYDACRLDDISPVKYHDATQQTSERIHPISNSTCGVNLLSN